MQLKPRRRRPGPRLQTNTPPGALREHGHRTDIDLPPDSMPPSDERETAPSDYEREIDRLDAAVRARSR